MTVDGDPVFQRSDSIEECPTVNEDADTISVYSTDEQVNIDKAWKKVKFKFM